MDDQNYVKSTDSFVGVGVTPRHKPRKTRNQILKSDLEISNLTREAALERVA